MRKPKAAAPGKWVHLLMTFFIISCNENPAKINLSSLGASNYDSILLNQGKNWIITKVEAYYNIDSLHLKGFKFLCTPEYAAFKQDLISVEFDEFTHDELKKKWGRRFTESAGIGKTFMLGVQDYGHIVVSECEFLNITEMGHLRYRTVFKDTTHEMIFTREIILVQKRGSFLIDGVTDTAVEDEV